MDRRTRTAPDGDARATGSSDTYLAEVVRQRHSLLTPGARPHHTERPAWDGEERRQEDVSCYDPYLVGLTRGGRSSP
jgi:hypothetical protein